MYRVLFFSSLAIAIFSFVPVAGILSPLNQSAVEIKAIVEDKQLSDMFGESEQIEAIRKTPHGYVVIGLKHRVRVIVEYKRQDMPGAKPFNLLFLTPENK